MEMTQQDFEARKQRVDAGVGTDEDARLVKLYEREGYRPSAEIEPQPDSDSAESAPGGGSAPDGDAEPDDGSTAHGRGRGAGRTARAK